MDLRRLLERVIFGMGCILAASEAAMASSEDKFIRMVRFVLGSFLEK